MREKTKPGSAIYRARIPGWALMIGLLVFIPILLLGSAFLAVTNVGGGPGVSDAGSRRGGGELRAAVEAIARGLQGEDNYYHYTHPRAPWVLRDPDPQHAGELGAGRYLVEELQGDELHFKGRLKPTSTLPSGVYRAKVLDCASQINLNCGFDNLAMMLDNLGRALQKSPAIGFNPLYAGFPQRGNRVRGSDIVQHRRRLKEGRFARKAQLRELIGEQNFELIADFVTVHSWIDPTTVRSGELTELASSRIDEAVGHHPVYGDHRPVPDPRAPVNLNTAPREVLAALFAGIACRRPFPYVDRMTSRIGKAEFQAGFVPRGSDRFPSPARPGIGGQEEVNYTIRPVWVYTPRIDFAQAWQIAALAVQERRKRPFVCWKAGKREAGGFAEFVYTRVAKSMLPRPNIVTVIAPYLSTRRHFEGAIRAGGGGNPALQYLWQVGTSIVERVERRRTGLAVNDSCHWFYETVRSAILSNFNPNTRLSSPGYNLGACLPVDKSSLVSPWHPDPTARTRVSRSEVYAGYTTELCFDSQGLYEVTVLGGRRDPRVVGGTSLRLRKARAVVRVFEVLRHTTQEDFALPWRHERRTSWLGYPSSWNGVMTYPEPLIAASDYVSRGSRIDGRIELMGALDAAKVKLDPSARDAFCRPVQNVLFHHDWMFRSSREELEFHRMGRARLAKQTHGQDDPNAGRSEKLFSSVFDAPYARHGRQYAWHYTPWPDRHGSNAVLTGKDGTKDVLTPVLRWPRINEEALEYGNLRPDGLHTSIFSQPTRRVGIPMYPANQITTGQGWITGQNGARHPLVGGRGNVHYYEGGVALWVKFDVDARDPIFCGLVGCTQVVSNVGKKPNASEGNQFYIFKTSFGELRVVRLYYHHAFGASSTDGADPLPPLPSRKKVTLDCPVIPHGRGRSLDPNKAFARSEVLVDISGWNANEWHHVAISWKDGDPSERRVRVFVDSQPSEAVTGVQYGLLGAGKSVALNTREPYDELTIGGILRRQAIAQEGLFKFAYNLKTSGTEKGAQSGGSGAFVQPDLKVLPANATIDDFFSFVGSFESFRDSSLGGLTRNRFVKKGHYRNTFPIAPSPGTEPVRLRSFTWTEYQPPFFHGARGQVVYLTRTPVRAAVEVGEIRREFDRAPWHAGKVAAPNPLGGLALGVGGTGGRATEVVYHLDLKAAEGSGSYGGVAVAAPVVDDVTLAYFLPTPEILSWEDLSVKRKVLAAATKGRRGVQRRLGNGKEGRRRR